MLKITKLPVGDLEANCFIVADDEMNAVIIDPGADGHIILDEIAAQGVKPLAMLLTHAHFDHFGAAADIMKEYPQFRYVEAVQMAESAHEVQQEMATLGLKPIKRHRVYEVAI